MGEAGFKRSEGVPPPIGRRWCPFNAGRGWQFMADFHAYQTGSHAGKQAAGRRAVMPRLPETQGAGAVRRRHTHRSSHVGAHSEPVACPRYLHR